MTHTFYKKTLGILMLLVSVIFTTNAQSVNEIPLTVEYSLKGGFYDDDITIQLAASLSGSNVFYTTNGDEPNGPTAKIYKSPIKIKKTTILRAIARRADKKSKTFAETYFVNEPKTNFPVVSFAVPPQMLFDPIDGLFVQGQKAIDSLYYKPGANFWSRVEVPIHMQFFESDGQEAFNSRTGFRLFGGMSRLFPQKSFTIVARKRYGKKNIKHRVFGKKGLKKYKYLVFRNSGSDFSKSHFRDAFMGSLTDGWDIEKQDYRPSHVYINGNYWGVYNIREKINRHFLKAKTGIDKDSLDLLEHQYSLKQGSKRHYIRMLKYMIDHSLREDYHFATIESMMDVENFMDYKIAQIYFDNDDAGGNIKYYRPQTPDGRWRWILYDTDWGYGLHNKDAYKANSLKFHTATKGKPWPNPPWSTFILRKLLENEKFRNKFANRMCDRLNSSFSVENTMAKLDEHYQLIAPEIDRQLDRWNITEKRFNKHVDIMRTFGTERPQYVRKHFAQKFELGEEVQVNIASSNGGKVVVNQTVEIIDKPLDGIYFEKLPIHINAIPHFGYRFVGWEGIDIDSDTRSFTLPLTEQRYEFKAIFEKYNHPLAEKIIINEISCNNKMTKDWLELYNNSDEPVKLRDWVLTDKKHEYRLNDVTIMPKDYVVFSEDSSKFFRIFPKAYSVAGSFDFGLDKRNEVIGLFTDDGAFIDSVSYEVAPTDTAFTLNLLLPWLDNSDLDNWEIRKGFGSPNSANPYYVESSIQKRQRLWMEMGAGITVILLCMLALYFRKEGVLKI